MPQLLIRLDDACPTMDIEKWQDMEIMLDELDIKPLVAVVPNNADPHLNKSDYDSNFWRKVRVWQDKGWEIALHGYDHSFISKSSGLVPFNKFSEFAGVSYDIQKEKILSGIEKFKQEGIDTHIWVAPAHSFDEKTLEILSKYTEIDTISDGLSNRTYTYLGFKWVPQTLWKAKTIGDGINTICYHPNELSKERLEEESNKLLKLKEIVTTFDSVCKENSFKQRNMSDTLRHTTFMYKIMLLKLIMPLPIKIKKVIR